MVVIIHEINFIIRLAYAKYNLPSHQGHYKIQIGIECYRSGEAKLFGFFMGQVMRATKGKADPNAARQRLQEMLDA